MAPTAPSPAKSASPSQPSGKSEVSDLKQQLRQLAGSRAPDADDQRRDVFKRVISCMTAGIDVSAAFGEMVLCSATSDVVLKKMCYLYVGVHARAHPDLALLTINFLQRDCRDQDPTIRGLALRSLCSLRVPNLVEYLVTPLTTGLKDPSAYVRMVAAVGAAKLYHISATTCLDADLPASLKALMLSDPDAQVVANCLHSLLEIWTLEAANSEAAGREIETLYSKPVVFYLLNKIKEFSEWAQCHVLELASKFLPSDNNEIFDIMNLLEDRLQHANGAVVLATIKVFLHLTMSMTDVHQQVYERIKAPLLTLVGAGSPEQSYSVLCHLHLLVMRAPMLFSSDYKSFYCQFSDPSYVKKLKLEMLTAIANESNTYEIVTELCEYAGNVDVPIARESIRAVGKIALQQYDVNAIVDRLLQFLEMDKDYVTAETLVLVKDLLRKYPQWSHDCIAVVGNISSQNIQEPKGKAALIWMLGEYSQDMHDAPYVLENLVDNWDEDNIVYKGRWKLNRKHGLGCQTYPNGDMFQGSWIQGEIQGHGKYTWENGNTYTGNMKNGKMSGKGTFTWKNGDSYEGNWLDGMMHGYGIYTWSDCGYYVGTWTRGLKDGKGTLYPSGCRVPAGDELYIKNLRNRGVLPDPRRQNHGSRILHSSSVDMGNMKVGINRESASSRRNTSDSRNVSLERRWSLEVAIEKFIGNENSETSENIDDSELPILEREYMQGVLISEVVLDRSFSGSSKKAKRRQKKTVRETKKPGEAIIKGHRSYDLMLSLQLGIRYTVGKITPIQKREVRASDFGPRASFWMNFPKEGSRLTPSHPAEDFKWKDYCPMVFRNLREMFKIDAADYMISICGNSALRELSSPGKSGSVFFLSQDDRFMIKTLRKSEVQVLLRMLPNYYNHVHTYENTLITKFFGLHRVKPSSGQKFRFVVMGNMFCTELRIHRRFDLKGSSLGRSTDKIEIDENTTLKDLDLNYSFYLEPSWREALLKQIKTDSEFLKSQRIMDYSLLLGVHYRAPQHLRTRASYRRSMTAERLTVLSEEDAQEDDAFNYPEGLVLVQRANDENSVVVGPHIRGSRLRSSAAGFGEVDLLLPGTARVQIQLGVNMPARAEQIPKEDDSKSFYEVYDVVLYLGIIDILQEYNITKKIEHAVKSMQYDSVSISAVDPEFYSERFLKFIQTVFPENS